MAVNSFIEKIKDFAEHHRWIYVFLLTLTFVNESFPTTYDLYILINDFYRIIIFFVMIFLFYKKKKKISKLLLFMFFIETWVVISTVINHGLNDWDVYLRMVYDICAVLSLGMIVEYFIDEPSALIKGLMLNFEIALYSYFYAFIMKELEEGKYPKGLLNTMALWILTAVCLALLYMAIEKKYIRSGILLGVSLFIAYLIDSATVAVALAGLFAVLLFCFVLKKYKGMKFPFWILIIAAVGLNLFVLFVYSGISFPLVDFLIEKVLGKTTDFTLRTDIWAEAIRMIREKPIFGHGFRPLFVTERSTSSHCHNQLLERFSEGGIIGFSLFIIFYLTLCKKIDRDENSLVRIIIMSSLFGIFLTFITEAYKKFFVFYIVIFIAYHVDRLIDNK